MIAAVPVKEACHWRQFSSVKESDSIADAAANMRHLVDTLSSAVKDIFADAAFPLESSGLAALLPQLNKGAELLKPLNAEAVVNTFVAFEKALLGFIHKKVWRAMQSLDMLDPAGNYKLDSKAFWDQPRHGIIV